MHVYANYANQNESVEETFVQQIRKTVDIRKVSSVPDSTAILLYATYTNVKYNEFLRGRCHSRVSEDLIDEEFLDGTIITDIFWYLFGVKAAPELYGTEIGRTYSC